MNGRFLRLSGRSRGPRRPRRRGAILIVAMTIIFALASLVLVLGQSTRVEAIAGANRLATEQAAAIARGAEQYVLARLAEDPGALLRAGPQEFAAVPVGEGFFWLLRPDHGDSGLPEFGVVDESAKLDLNTMSLDTLRRIPGMTEEIAAAIIDWRDEDEEVTEGGAESQTYLAQPIPYRAKNAPLECVEELLLIQGVTPEHLYGDPAAEAGRVVVHEPLAAGWFDLFTVWSRQSNSAPGGGRRININAGRQRDELRNLLRSQLGQDRGNELAGRIPPGDFRNLFDFALRLQLRTSELEQLEPYISTSGSRRPRGRVNLNAAPREVLLSLGDLSSSDVDALLARRGSLATSKPDSIAWVLDVLRDKAAGLGDQVGGHGMRYSADILAVSGNGRAFKRVRIVIEAGSPTPRIIHRRDRTDQGWPLDWSILDSLRTGERSLARDRSSSREPA